MDSVAVQDVVIIGSSIYCSSRGSISSNIAPLVLVAVFILTLMIT